MPNAWRVPQNTICLAVKEVCQAIVDEYKDELMTCPTTLDGWRKIAGGFYSKWNFPPLSWCFGRQAYCHEMSVQVWIRLLQLQGVLLGGTIHIGGRKLQIYLG